MDDASCGYCGALRALLHCAQHAARLCLPCDVTVHAAARSHERAPLCDGCHAAPAATRCIDHEAALCTACATAASCDAERHRRRPTRTYTGFPEPADLARILSLGTLPPSPLPEPNTWVPDLVNIELPGELSNNAWGNGNTIITELPSDSFIRDGGNLDDQISAEMAGSAALLSGHGDEFFAQEDWPILHDVGLDDFNFAASVKFDSNLSNSVNPIGRTEGVFEPQASASLGYDRPSISSCSETIMPSDAFLQSLTSNSAACQFSSVGTNTSSNVMLPRDELPSRHFGFEVPSAASQEAPPPEKSSQDMEARTKQREKRQQAKQRYNDKKKNRRFGKQIMYVSRKARADTRNRVKGRFAKASSSAHGDNPDMQP